MEVPGPGLNWSCSCQSTPQPQQCYIWAEPATHTTAHGKAGPSAHWVGPDFEPTSSWRLVRFVGAEPQRELPTSYFSPCLFFLHTMAWSFIIYFLLVVCNQYPTSDGFSFHNLSKLCLQGSVDLFPLAQKSSFRDVTPHFSPNIQSSSHPAASLDKV